MHTVGFKIENKDGNTYEVEFLVNDNIGNPSTPFSYPFNYISRALDNHKTLSDLLNKLIKDGYLEYCRTKDNRQIFKHHLSEYVNHFRMEYINVTADDSNNQRILEQALYYVCQTHNLPMPDIIKPKNMLMSMYQSYMYPATSKEEKRAQDLTLVAGMGALAFMFYRLRF